MSKMQVDREIWDWEVTPCCIVCGIPRPGPDKLIRLHEEYHSRQGEKKVEDPYPNENANG